MGISLCLVKYESCLFLLLMPSTTGWTNSLCKGPGRRHLSSVGQVLSAAPQLPLLYEGSLGESSVKRPQLISSKTVVLSAVVEFGFQAVV